MLKILISLEINFNNNESAKLFEKKLKRAANKFEYGLAESIHSISPTESYSEGMGISIETIECENDTINIQSSGARIEPPNWLVDSLANYGAKKFFLREQWDEGSFDYYFVGKNRVSSQEYFGKKQVHLSHEEFIKKNLLTYGKYKNDQFIRTYIINNDVDIIIKVLGLGFDVREYEKNSNCSLLEYVLNDFHDEYDSSRQKNLEIFKLFHENGANIKRRLFFSSKYKQRSDIIEYVLENSKIGDELYSDFEYEKMIIEIINNDCNELWAEIATQDLLDLSTKQKVFWFNIIKHCAEHKLINPSKEWIESAKYYIEEIDDYTYYLSKWLQVLGENDVSCENIHLMKGLIWACSIFNDQQMASILSNTAILMYKKISSHSAINIELANAAAISLSLMDDVVLADIMISRLSTEDSASNIISEYEGVIVASISRVDKEPWTEIAFKYLLSIPMEQQVPWSKILRHCIDSNSTKPSKRWIKVAKKYIEDIKADDFRLALIEWLSLLKKSDISSDNTQLLRGLVWCCSVFNDEEMTRALRTVAIRMYKKVSGFGVRNPKLANSAVIALSLMDDGAGLGEICTIRSSTKYNAALIHINRVFDKLANDRGISSDELAQLMTPDYGLSEIGRYSEKLDDCSVTIELVQVGRAEITWINKQGKAQKSIPITIKKAFSSRIKELQELAKDLQVSTRAHRNRIEQMYLSNHHIEYHEWQDKYLNHPLVGFLSRRLIWTLILSNGSSKSVIYFDGALISSNNEAVELSDIKEVIVWHPCLSSTVEVLAWRNFLVEKQITQPFKQAHREIYLLTDAERSTGDYSLRFSGHLLKQHQFHALTTQRSWKQTRGGPWDGGQETEAYKPIPKHKMSVTFNTSAREDLGFSTGLYDYLNTNSIIFSDHSGEHYRRMDLEEVDQIVFSEVMRDVDLFVGVASVGNDPEWEYRDQYADYWSGYSFGDLSEIQKTRKDVLEMLLPKLSISKQVHIEDRFLIVKGAIRTYKIHIGSSNILMEPNDQYLCIVSAKKKTLNLFVPFEGDTRLAMILSKAFLLAKDNKITDSTILSQIKMVEDY